MPHIAYRTHSNAIHRLQVATGLSLEQIHAQDLAKIAADLR
jgi:hypothetical protein